MVGRVSAIRTGLSSSLLFLPRHRKFFSFCDGFAAAVLGLVFVDVRDRQKKRIPGGVMIVLLVIVFYLYLILIFLYDFNGRLSIDFGSVVSCWVNCQKNAKCARLGLIMAGSDAVRRGDSKTGLGSIIVPLYAELLANMWFIHGSLAAGC